MPATVNIERHKLNQTMYQKLKRYIMNKRKRELEERAQDDQYKKLKREREERKRQAELDVENLEKTKGELLSTRKKIKELTDQRNELFQRWKQLSSEESNLKEKQRSETIALLANMPNTQFGISPSGIPNNSRPPATRSHTPSNIPPAHIQHVQPGKQYNIAAGSTTHHPVPTHFAQQSTQRDAPSPAWNSHSAVFPGSINKSSQLPHSSSAIPGAPSPGPRPGISTSHAAALTAVAAALAAQQRSGAASDSVFSTTAAAAAYLNAIVSLTSSAPLSVPSLNNNLFNMLNPNSPGFAEAIAALAATGLYTLPSSSSSSHLPGNSFNTSHPVTTFGHHTSPVITEANFARDGGVFASLTRNTGSSNLMAKGFPQAQRHPTTTEINQSVDSSHSNLVNAAPQLPQKQPQTLLGSLSTNNPLLSLLPDALTLEHAAAAAAAGNVSGTTLPPAQISYRGSITTGQSAQQIQLQQQQQAHQKHQQQHTLSRFLNNADFSASRGCTSQNDPSLNNTARATLNTNRLSDAAALMASIGVTSASALLNSSLLSTNLASSAPNSTTTSTSNSQVALTAVLAPYAAELNNLNYLTTATLAAAIQQQQQQFQKLNTNNLNNNNNSASPRPRASPAGSNTPMSNTPSMNNAHGRHFF